MKGHNGTPHQPTTHAQAAAGVIRKTKRALAGLGQEPTQRNVGLYLIGVGLSNALASGLTRGQLVALVSKQVGATPADDQAAKEAIVDLTATEEPA